MSVILPIISGAGLFHSQDRFTAISQYQENTVTKLRTVIDYELELFITDIGISHINGKSFPITKGALLLAQLGDKRQSTLHFSAHFLHFNTSDSRTRELLQSIHGFHSNVNYVKYEPLLIDICETALTFEPDSDILASSKLLSLLFTLKRDLFISSKTIPVTNHQSVVSQAIEYMKQS